MSLWWRPAAEPKNKRPPLAVFYSILFCQYHRFCYSSPHTARKGACEGGTFAGFSLKMRPIAPNGALQAFCRRQNLGTGGIHFRRARSIPLGWSGEPPRNPKIKDRRWRSFIFGASGDTELFEKASNINGFQGGRVANNLYISPFRATVFKTAALFLHLNSSVVIRVRKPLFFPL